MDKQISNLKKDYKETALVLLLCYEQLLAGPRWIFAGLGINLSVEVIRWLIIGIIGAALVWFLLNKVGNRIYRDILYLVGGFAILYLISSLNSQNLEDLLRYNLVFSTFIECIPVYILFRYVKNYDEMWIIMRFFAFIMLGLYVISFFCYNVGDTYNYRTFSSGLTYSSAIFLIEWLYRNKRTYSIFSVVSMLLIATCGRRSSFIALAVCFLIIMIYTKRYRYIVAVGIIAFAIFAFRQRIFSRLYEIVSMFGVRPRILYRISVGTISDDSHRFEMWRSVINKVMENPYNMLFGLGLGGERFPLRSSLYSLDLSGQVHNIIVELIGQFGIVIGPIVSLWIIVVEPVKTFNYVESDENLKMIFIFTCTLASSLLFQDDYLKNKYFFLLIAIFVTARKIRNVNPRN